MDFITQILLGFCLATDAFAVSISNGMCSYKVTKKNVLSTAFTFGFFQGIMPILGFIFGNRFTGVISRYQHFIALFLLGAIGLNMIVDAVKDKKNPEGVCKARNVFASKNLIIQGIATSIDALAVGVSLAALDANITTTALLIGTITFFCCSFGVYIGRKFGLLLGIRAKFGGGILLILLGIKIFVENII
ncbi:MAG: manganese efflux pump [Clostridiales bacterium]|jgi:putative Mn2+ efflux pump MntP|nr:manganese efflux pump [Clostridiales bacterium]